jgi:transposase-like protein
MLTRAGIPLRRYGSVELPPPEELGRLYIEEKLSTRGLAAHFGVHQATIWRALNEAGVPGHPRGGWAKPKWPEWIAKDVLEQLYVAERLPMREVARRLGVWDTTVRRALVGYGIPIELHQPNRRRPTRDELVDLYVHQGLSTKDLAVRFGVHRRTPWHWLDDAGIPRRPGRGVRVARGGQAPLASSPRAARLSKGLVSGRRTRPCAGMGYGATPASGIGTSCAVATRRRREDRPRRTCPGLRGRARGRP